MLFRSCVYSTDELIDYFSYTNIWSYIYGVCTGTRLEIGLFSPSYHNISHLGHGVGGRSFVQKQERHLLVIVMRCDMERGEAVL